MSASQGPAGSDRFDVRVPLWLGTEQLRQRAILAAIRRASSQSKENSPAADASRGAIPTSRTDVMHQAQSPCHRDVAGLVLSGALTLFNRHHALLKRATGGRQNTGTVFISVATAATLRLLSDGQSNPWPVLDFGEINRLRFSQVAASVEHALEPAFLNLLLDLVVVAMVRQQRLVGFFVGPICSWLHLSQSLARYT